MFASSSRPWIAPSSPSLPCNTGTTTSSLICSYPSSVMDKSPCTLRSGDSTAGRQLPLFSQCSPGPSQSFHSPSSVIPTQNGSYFSVSRCFANSCADLMETGCSSEQPPNRMPSFNLATLVLAFEGHTVDQTVLD